MSYMDFSSWPRDQEQSFVVYEQRQADSQRQAYMIGGIVGAIALVFGLGIYAGVTPDNKEMKGMHMENLNKKSRADEAAPAPAPKPAAAPAAAPAPSGDTKAPDSK